MASLLRNPSEEVNLSHFVTTAAPAFSGRGAGYQRIAGSLPAAPTPSPTWVSGFATSPPLRSSVLRLVWGNPPTPDPLYSGWALFLSSFSGLVISFTPNFHFSFGGKASSEGKGFRESPAFQPCSAGPEPRRPRCRLQPSRPFPGLSPSSSISFTPSSPRLSFILLFWISPFCSHISNHNSSSSRLSPSIKNFI